MKIGIFLGYGPQVVLGKEGLGRYLGGLLKGFQDQCQEITIACPHWLLKTLGDLFDDFQIDTKRIQWVTTEKEPPVWRIYLFLSKKREHWSLHDGVVKMLKGIFHHCGIQLSTAQGLGSFLIWCVLYFLVGLLCLLPAVIAIVLNGILSLAKKLFHVIKDQSKKIAAPGIQLDFFHSMNSSVLNSLVRKINAKPAQDVWYVPGLFWPEVNSINAPVVINAPDLVSQEFAQGFANVFNSENAICDCRKTLTEGKYFICYSEYLRDTLLIKQYGKPTQNSVAISHPTNELDSYIQISDSIQKRLNATKNFTDAFAHYKLGTLPNVSCQPQYAALACWRQYQFIFYASQNRPNKNIFNLIKAYEYLLRRKFIPYKLFLTADLKKDEDIWNYLCEHGLENDVIGLYNVPTQTLASLYHCAELVVNPTLYEGGFPFTFGEGMSVGTPSIMSDIPQVREVLEPAGLSDIMFDPYDWKAIAAKMEWALAEKENLYKKELPLYETMAERTPALVAAEYVKAFASFASRGAYEQKNQEGVFYNE